MAVEGLESDFAVFAMKTAEGIINWLIEHEPDCRGCLFGVAEGSCGNMVMLRSFGIIDDQETYDYPMAFAQEKPKRLAANPSHYTLWESRDVAAKRFGGAVRFGDFIVFSTGLKEILDDAAMLLLVCKLFGGYMHAPKWLKKSAAANPYFEQLRNGLRMSGRG